MCKVAGKWSELSQWRHKNIVALLVSLFFQVYLFQAVPSKHQAVLGPFFLNQLTLRLPSSLILYEGWKFPLFSFLSKSTSSSGKPTHSDLSLLRDQQKKKKNHNNVKTGFSTGDNSQILSILISHTHTHTHTHTGTLLKLDILDT